MSPRKTRRGKAKADSADDTISTTLNDSHLPESPSIHSRSLRTRRAKDPKDVPKTPKTPKKVLEEIVEPSPQPIRRTRAKKPAAEPLDQSNISLNTTAKKRGRKPKNPETSEDTQDEKPEPEKKPRGRKKIVEEITIKDSPEPQKIDLPPPDSDDNEVANVSATIPKSAPTNRRFRQLKGKNTPDNITPESSPITVTLTPHRSTKTPRKSPVNLSSPRTHSISPRRSSKTPRKLSVVSASPVPSDGSSNGTPGESSKTLKKMTPKTLKTTPKTQKMSPKTPKSTPKTQKLTPKSPKVTPKPQKTTPKTPISKPPPSTSKNRTTLHSKTPKIVLRKSKSKSPPSVLSSKVKRSLKTSLSPKKSPKTPAKSPKSPKKSPKSAKKSPKTPNSSLQPEEDPKSPQLILRRISSPSTSSSGAVEPLDKSLDKSQEKSPKPLTSRLHALQSELRSSTPRERPKPSGASPVAVEKFYGSPRSQTRSSRSLLLEDESNPLISDDDSFQISGIKPTDDRTRSIHRDNTYDLIEPKTPNLKKKKTPEEKDDTYDLEEPKTPGLRRLSLKRSPETKEPSPDDEIASKRVCRVRFASPEAGKSSKSSTKVVSRSRSATPSSKLMKKPSPTGSGRRRSSSMSNVPKSPGAKWSQKAQNESINRLSKPRLSISMTDTDKKKKIEGKGSSAKKVPNFAQIHQKKFERMESLVDAKKRIELRHNALTSSNIGNIKEGLSEKANSEKLSEKTEKIEKDVKAPIMNEPKVGFNRFGFKLKDQVTPVGAAQKKEGYNRFGFKLTKQEATKIVARPTAARLEERKEATRTQLKGVRTNKRFELLMKSRNMK